MASNSMTPQQQLHEARMRQNQGINCLSTACLDAADWWASAQGTTAPTATTAAAAVMASGAANPALEAQQQQQQFYAQSCYMQ
jgi:hypothetical protein